MNIQKENKKTEPFTLPDGIYWVYALKCDGGYYYIGVTTNVERRFSQHREGGEMCANFTKKHKPLKVLYKARLGFMSYKEAEEYEDCVTLEAMMKYGGKKCAGGRFFSPLGPRTAIRKYEKKSDKYKAVILDLIPEPHQRTVAADIEFRRARREKAAAERERRKREQRKAQRAQRKKQIQKQKLSNTKCKYRRYDLETQQRFEALNPKLMEKPKNFQKLPRKSFAHGLRDNIVKVKGKSLAQHYRG